MKCTITVNLYPGILLNAMLIIRKPKKAIGPQHNPDMKPSASTDDRVMTGNFKIAAFRSRDRFAIVLCCIDNVIVRFSIPFLK